MIEFALMIENIRRGALFPPASNLLFR